MIDEGVKVVIIGVGNLVFYMEFWKKVGMMVIFVILIVKLVMCVE